MKKRQPEIHPAIATSSEPAAPPRNALFEELDDINRRLTGMVEAVNLVEQRLDAYGVQFADLREDVSSGDMIMRRREEAMGEASANIGVALSDVHARLDGIEQWRMDLNARVRAVEPQPKSGVLRSWLIKRLS